VLFAPRVLVVQFVIRDSNLGTAISYPPGIQSDRYEDDFLFVDGTHTLLRRRVCGEYFFSPVGNLTGI
jgi:hypothetical protein